MTIKSSRGALGAAQEEASRANPERNLESPRPPSKAWGAAWVTSRCLSHLCGVWEGERALYLRPRPQRLWLPEHLCSSAPFLMLGCPLWLQILAALLKVRGGADGTRACPFPSGWRLTPCWCRGDRVMSVKLWTALSHRFCWATANNDCASTARPCSNTVSENVNKKWKDLKTLLMGIQSLGCHHVFPSFSFFCSPPTCPEKCKESQRIILLLALVLFFFKLIHFHLC